MSQAVQDHTDLRTRILIIEDHPFVRHTLKKFLNNEPDMEVCGVAENTKEALPHIKDSRPDLVIFDLSLFKQDGFSLTRQLRGSFPDLPILVLSMHSEFLFAERALRAGANGFVTKSEAIHKLVPAVHQIMEGKLYVSESVRQAILQRIRGVRLGDSGIESLSDRELEIFHLMGNGYGLLQIARMLNLHEKTVETHRFHIKKKLGISDNAELLKKAAGWVNQSGPN